MPQAQSANKISRHQSHAQIPVSKLCTSMNAQHHPHIFLTHFFLCQVIAGKRGGVHHPKFGLLFLHDGSLVFYVGTGNLGTDTAVDATW